ncbi:MAG: hypothetical protein KBB04_04545 [Methanothrix sp.]|uniref:hypothetical protein n=1 Tax=Methanothrix sp. TaxID=90426 RepID=UPI001B40D475|nr:hypothetical protein [Methanothrix sp.]MBP7067530.1 hypothetical protein [Methanothrix sp.]
MKRITFFKLGKLWVFKHFFDNNETFKFKDLAENYNENKFRFEFKTFGERNKTLRILDRAVFDYELLEDLRTFVAKQFRYSNMHRSLRMFLMRTWHQLRRPEGSSLSIVI